MLREGVVLVLLFAIYVSGSSYSQWLAEKGPLSQFGGLKYYSEPQKLEKLFSSKVNAESLTPVVIIPSLIGSQLWASLDGAHEEHWWCYSNSDSYLVWIDETQFYPFIVDCWAHNMQLTYQNQTYSPPPGVRIDTPDYGGLDGVAYLDKKNQIGIWNDVIGNLTEVGYTPGLNLRAAPYDWRIGPNAYNDLFVALQNLIEDTFSKNGNKQVALVSLSMGGPYANLFLNTMSQAWKDKFVHSFTSLSGAFGGAVTAPLSIVSLINMGDPYLDPKLLRNVIQSYGSIVWLSPSYEVYKDNILVWTPTKNYTAADFLQLYLDANAEISAQIMNDIDKYRDILSPPGVPTNCIMGYNLTTLYSFGFNVTDDFDNAAYFTVTDGDGTVPTEGLEVCSSWAGKQAQPVKTYRFVNMNHADPVHYLPVIELFKEILGV